MPEEFTALHPWLKGLLDKLSKPKQTSSHARSSTGGWDSVWDEDQEDWEHMAVMQAVDVLSEGFARDPETIGVKLEDFQANLRAWGICGRVR